MNKRQKHTKQLTQAKDFLLIPKDLFKDNNLDVNARWLFVTLLYCEDQGITGKDTTYIEGSLLNEEDYYIAKKLLIKGGYINEHCNILNNKNN